MWSAIALLIKPFFTSYVAPVLKYLVQPKVLLTLFVLLILGYGQWSFYNYAHQRGVKQAMAVYEPKLQAAQSATQKAQDELAEYKAAYVKWKEGYDEATAQLKEEQARITSEQDRKLKSRDAEIQSLKKELQNAIPNYVPASANVVVPSGFIGLYTRSLEAQPATWISELSLGDQGDAGDPTDLDLRGLAEVLTENNAACLQYRDRLLRWQSWYVTQKAAYDKAVQEALKNTAPTTK